MWFIKLLQKRPSDLQIRIGKIIFGLFLVSSLYYNVIIQGDKIDNNYFWVDVSPIFVEYLTYFFVGIGIIPVISGIVNRCVLKKKYIRILQIIFGILLFYISNQIIPLDPDKLDVDILITLMGIFPIIAGITGKAITTNCLKYKEKITKIRV